MKRTNLIVDEKLLKQAKRLLETDTYSATVNLALQEVIKSHNIKQIADLFGSGIWSGELSTMREDKSPPKTKKSKRK
ncbi:MAG: type II toxin-antitoxin system VapB family antitoxin [Oligoflexales bacterium]|nr:type II toxin-antitoxin system VapB family antitoxin [Oligoflexales bacterium]